MTHWKTIFFAILCGCTGSGDFGAGYEFDGGVVQEHPLDGVADAGEEVETQIKGLGGRLGDEADAGGDGDGDGDGDEKPTFLLVDVLEGRWAMTRTVTYPPCADVDPPDPTTVEHGVVITPELLMHHITEVESVYWEAGYIEDEVWYPDATLGWFFWSNPEVFAVTRDHLRGTAVKDSGRCELNTWVFDLVRML